MKAASHQDFYDGHCRPGRDFGGVNRRAENAGGSFRENTAG
jgi:hypothetical protein